MENPRNFDFQEIIYLLSSKTYVRNVLRLRIDMTATLLKNAKSRFRENGLYHRSFTDSDTKLNSTETTIVGAQIITIGTFYINYYGGRFPFRGKSATAAVNAANDKEFNATFMNDPNSKFVKLLFIKE